MVLISRAVARVGGVPGAGGGEETDCESVVESQDVGRVEAVGADAGAGAVVVSLCGFGAVPEARAWASHASRVLWSTGQASAGLSWEDMVVR
jgi:hypothetical protein